MSVLAISSVINDCIATFILPFLTVGIAICALISADGFTKKNYDKGGLSLLFCVIGIVICCIIVGHPASYHFEHQATFTDPVDMNDFLSRYKILSQDGLILTIQPLH